MSADSIAFPAPRPHSHGLYHTIIQLTAKRDNELADIQMACAEKEITADQRQMQCSDVKEKWRAEVAKVCEAFFKPLEEFMAENIRIEMERIDRATEPRNGCHL